jgi:hypothetical protein
MDVLTVMTYRSRPTYTPLDRSIPITYDLLMPATNGSKRKVRSEKQTTVHISKALGERLRKQADKAGMRVFDFTERLMEKAVESIEFQQ